MFIEVTPTFFQFGECFISVSSLYYWKIVSQLLLKQFQLRGPHNAARQPLHERLKHGLSEPNPESIRVESRLLGHAISPGMNPEFWNTVGEQELFVPDRKRNRWVMDGWMGDIPSLYAIE
jgi:hypothetical protein